MGKKPEPFIKPKLVLVEGQDEVNLFTHLLKHIGLDESIDVREVKGKSFFPDEIKNLHVATGYNSITSIGIVRDADDKPSAAFKSVVDALHKANLPEPTAPLEPKTKTSNPTVTILIVPDINDKGMIEDVCLSSVSDYPAMACVESYFECLKEQNRILDENDVPKARVRAFLASREWLEIAHFEYLQKCMQNYEPVLPTSPAVSVAKVHAFLASRYTPDLRLGAAAGKTDDGYWQFDHPAFNKIKQFLRML